MPKTFFSIITCTYNSQTYLKDCIKSVETQSFDKYQHIFIDANSSDKTIPIIKAYQKRNPGKVFLYQFPPKGIAHAMNTGIKHAKGMIINHLHSDDYLYSPDVLAKMHSIISRHQDTGLFFGDCKFRRGNKYTPVFSQNPMERYLHHKLIRCYILLTNKIPHPSVFIRRQVFVRWGDFDTQYKIVMDYEYWLRVLRREKYLFVDDFLSVYRVHSKTVSSNRKVTSREINSLLKRYKNIYLAERIINIFFRPLLKIVRRLKL